MDRSTDRGAKERSGIVTRYEAFDLLVLASHVLMWMKRPQESALFWDGATWLDPSFSLVTLEEIHTQAKAIRSFAMKRARLQGAETTRSWLFAAEILRSIDS